MSNLPIRSLTELPLILAGPMLRHTTSAAVTVWVALQTACQVNLRVFATTDNGNQIGNLLWSGSRETIALGKHLHIVTVTATAGQAEELIANRIYAYDLTFGEIDLQLLDPPSQQQNQQSLSQAMSGLNLPNFNLSYFAHQYPTFVLPPTQIADLRIVHGSCRQPHGDGGDALTILDHILAASANRPSERPQQLFLTGDQIYGDDVADPLAWVVSRLSEQLLGWTECLPSSSSQLDRQNSVTFGNRAEIATCEAGFTAGLGNRQHKVRNHLFSFGEYAAIYLLAWSPVCWPQVFPQGSSISRNRQVASKWDRQVRSLEQFIDGLGRVRRALANIPVYTIFDDHEVSDDWNLNQAWCLRVLSKPLGRKAVQNALLAYAIFQGWGNTPDRFELGRIGGKLLMAAQTWAVSGGTDVTADLEILRLVGMPPSDLLGMPKFVRDGEVSILDRDPDALSWNYTIDSSCHQVIVLDTRTWRGYHLDRSKIEPPMLLSPTAIDRQLSQPLQVRSPTDIPKQTFIIAPTNLFSLAAIDWIHHLCFNYYAADRQRHDRIFATDVGDAWNMHTPALARLLTTIFAHRDTVVVLSGDIHYGAVARLSYHQLAETSSAVLVQLTASSLKNEAIRTKLLHTHFKDWLFPEQIRHSIGWHHPPQMLPFRSGQLPQTQPEQPHDWSCSLKWMPRNRCAVANFASSELVPTRSTAIRFQLKYFLQQLMWWNSRWFQDGREVVGLNNLAVVQWRSRSIVQDLYWVSPWLPTQIVLSRFVAPLKPKSRRGQNRFSK